MKLVPAALIATTALIFLIRAPGAALHYALGVLYSYRYIRSEDKSDAFRAKDFLRTSSPFYRADPLHRVHLGMANSYIAKFRRILGLSNLREMHSSMRSIPEDHPDWLVRFLRGTTLVEVGAAIAEQARLFLEKIDE